MKTSDILRAAWALIDAPEKWWGNGGATGPNGRMCSVAAIGRRVSMGSADFWKAIYAMKEVLPHRQGIVSFNDSHSWPEVRDMWQRAISFAERDEALAEQQADGTLGELREIADEQEFGKRTRSCV